MRGSPDIEAGKVAALSITNRHTKARLALTSGHLPNKINRNRKQIADPFILYLRWRLDMKRRDFLKVIGGCGLLLSASRLAGAAESGKRPNVIIILADDLGCGDTSLYDGWIKTPRIDRMAREGVRFTDFHSNGSVCSPTRAALLTGRYQQRVGIVDVIAGHLDTPGLEATELTIPRLMKQNGYRTALFGKWHLGAKLQHNPTKHGFDEFVGFLPGGCDYLNHRSWRDGTKVKDQKGYGTNGTAVCD